MNVLMTEKGITDSGGMTYIHHKVGEIITKKSMATEDDIIEDDDAFVNQIFNCIANDL